MGTWGSELYQDDLAQETKDSFQDLLKKGKTTLEATEQLIRQNADVLNDVEEAPIFCFSRYAVGTRQTSTRCKRKSHSGNG